MANDMSPPRERGPIEITTFFAGTTVANGVFEDRSGRPRRRFSAQLFGQWEGSTFVLDETLSYDDGMVERRVWRIKSGQKGSFSATCAECVGQADGRHSTDGWRMRYQFRLGLARRSLTVAIDDRVYLTGPFTAINRATVCKFGVRLGDILIVYEKPDRLAASIFTNSRASVSA
jgi:hypothetical protein